MTDTDERSPAARILTVSEARFEAERRYNGYMAQDAFVAGASWAVNAHVAAEASAKARAEAAERLNGELVEALKFVRRYVQHMTAPGDIGGAECGGPEHCPACRIESVST